MGSAKAVSQVTEIVRSRLEQRPVVVVSALSKVTDMLYAITEAADEEALQEHLNRLKERHFTLVREVLQNNLKASIALQKELQAYIDFIRDCKSKGSLSDRDKAAIISCGELMSSRIVCAVLNDRGIDTAWVDARQMMVASGDPLRSEPDTDEINERAPQVIAPALSAAKAVITQGFICSSGSGKAALLGRGGSDYSASLIGRAIGADAVEIWTDVDGVRTADPRRVPTTRCLERLTYEQAAEMAHFGAKVLHPLTLEPAKEKDIPVYVLNTGNPDGESTVITREGHQGEIIKGVSYKEHIVVLTLSARQPMDSSAFLKKIFDTLRECKIGIDLISTGNSKVSVSFDSSHKMTDRAVRALESFAQVVLMTDKSQISAIGSSASAINSILGSNFAALEQSGIYMVSPGISFVNISFVVDRNQLDDVLRQTHKYLIENESCN